MNRRSKFRLIGTLVISLAVGLGLVIILNSSLQEKDETILSDESVVQFASYSSLTREEMIDQADIIFLGKVIDISPTRWNQDSGELWYDEATGYGLQLHTIKFEVLQPIVDTVGLEKQVTLTVLGGSPIEAQIDKRDGETISQGGPDHNLKIGNEAVIFARQTDLAWQDGTRPILELMGDPADAHFIRGDDGLYHGRPNEKPVSLDELINRVAQRRETLVQP